MIPNLPSSFLERPVAHRALHDLAKGRPENSRSAVLAAVNAGYGIEIDVQMSSDGVAMVFHDDTLDRLTAEVGPIRERCADDLAGITLKGGDETIPTFAEVLSLVAGRVPLLVEIKDQDGALGPNVGPLEAAVARELSRYEGPVAVMSFNPHSVAVMRDALPDCPRGLTTEDFVAAAESWSVPEARLKELSAIPDMERVGASFFSHNHRHLAHPRVSELINDGYAALCWTIRSPEEEAAALRIAQNITFEGYAPAGRT